MVPPQNGRPPSSTGHRSRSPTVRFPDFWEEDHHAGLTNDETNGRVSRGHTPLPNGLPNGLHSAKRWAARKTDSAGGLGAFMKGRAEVPLNRQRGRQKSLSEAIHTVRTRNMTISESAHEVAESLKAPISFRLVVCIRWERQQLSH